MFLRLETLIPGEPSLVRRALGSFVIQHSGDADRLADLLDAGHGPGVRRLAAALQRSASQIGATDLTEAAEALASEAASGCGAGTRMVLERVRIVLRQAIDAADSWLAEHRPVVPQLSDRDRELDTSLARLQTMVVARDWGALREAEQVAGAACGRLSAVQAAKLDGVVAALRRFLFDQAAQGLDALRKARA